jgi:aldose 1-epimerase
VITLRNGGAELDLLPEVGGAVSRFSVAGQDVLRPAPAGTTDVLGTGCFPLVPFANRIAHGRFSFDGDTVQLPRNFGDHPHALHGQGWQGAWQVLTQSAHAAELEFEHAADTWPWAYAARQSFALTPDVLRIGLAVINRSVREMPVSIGFHPYFIVTPQTRLSAHVGGVWLSDDTCIPTERAGAAHFLDLANGATVADAPFVDHCHYGWKGRAVIAQPDLARTLELTASPELDVLHCYLPQRAGFFCVEPVSAMPDAFNRPAAASGLRALAPGATLAASMTLRVIAQ